MDTIKYCKNCASTKNNTWFVHDGKKDFYAGYILCYKPEATKDMICPCCKGELTDTLVTNYDIDVIEEISNGNRQFLDEMVLLRNKDVIEYETKMAIFRNQAQNATRYMNYKKAKERGLDVPHPNHSSAKNYDYSTGQRIQRQSNPSSNRPTSPSQYSTTYTRDNTPAKVWSAPQNVPKCPTCGSTNIHKISTASKAGSVALWGIFSRKVHKQWHCDNCKSEW